MNTCSGPADSATVAARPFTSSASLPETLRRVAILWIICAAVLLAAHLWRETAVGLTDGGTSAFGDDAINFWSAPRLALQGRAAEIYDFARFHAFQKEVLGGPIHLYHYSYPPTAILLTWPLALLPYLAGWAVWLVGGWLVLVVTVRVAWPGGARNWRDPVLYALAMPATLLNSVTGQNGTWMAAILGGGCMLLERRPVLGGALLGTLTVKPQLALLVPVALLAGRRWHALGAFAFTGSALAATSAVLFGLDLWAAYAERAAVLRRWILEDGTGVWHLFASVFATVRHLPASLPVAYAAQGVAALFAVAAVLLVWRRQGTTPSSKNAVLVICTLAATPYVQVYDLVAAALVPLWLMDGAEDAVRERRRVDAVAVLAVMAPLYGFAVAVSAGFGATGPLLVLAAVLTVRRALGGEALRRQRVSAPMVPAGPAC